MPWLLIAGVALFAALHLFKGVLPGSRDALRARLGTNGYKVLWALLIVGSVVLIVLGWRGAIPTAVYANPTWGRHLAMLLMVFSIILFAASHGRNNLQRRVRHPQLTAVLVWAAAHLLANGDIRSVVLFGGLGAWAIVEIVLINRREGAWQKPEPVAGGRIAVPIVAGLVVYAVLFWSHRWFAGMPLMGA